MQWDPAPDCDLLRMSRRHCPIVQGIHTRPRAECCASPSLMTISEPERRGRQRQPARRVGEHFGTVDAGWVDIEIPPRKTPRPRHPEGQRGRGRPHRADRASQCPACFRYSAMWTHFAFMAVGENPRRARSHDPRIDRLPLLQGFADLLAEIETGFSSLWFSVRSTRPSES